MPAGLIEQHDGMRTRGDFGGDLVEMELHRLGVAGRQHQGGAGPALGADRTEQVRQFGALIVRGARARTLPGPAIGQLVLCPTRISSWHRNLLSSEHFSVDGTLIEAWASMKSFEPKDGRKPPSGKGRRRRGGRNTERDFRGEKRRNDTHSSTTDPDARLFRKAAGQEAKLCYMGHLMTENRNALIVDARLTKASGRAERATALDMIEDNVGPGSTVGGDKNFDTADFVAGCRKRGCTPHVSQNDTNRRSAIDARTTLLDVRIVLAGGGPACTRSCPHQIPRLGHHADTVGRFDKYSVAHLRADR